MSAVSALCTRAILMRGGRSTGPLEVSQAVASYLAVDAAASTSLAWEGDAGDESLKLSKFSVRAGDGAMVIRTDLEIVVEFCFEVKEPLEDVVIGLRLETTLGNLLAFSAQFDEITRKLPTALAPGAYRFKVTIPANTLAQGTYKAIPDIGVHNRKRIVGEPAMVQFTTVNTEGLGLHFLTGSGLENIVRAAWRWEQT